MDKSRFGSRWPDDADTLISMIQEKYEEPRTSIEMQLERLLAA